ncbi:MAG TPA: 3'(2'),5'-bisphosphate nucleotidase CysQ [Acidobacteriaceae bacterium]|nr:3'(2'),5'-bisphosphate nucleotidase CysQ [Acidobacteriaceae bacterium]
MRRIRDCLRAVAAMVSQRNLKEICRIHAHEVNPSTALDREIDRLIFSTLPRSDEGWLSEESIDSTNRLCMSRIWIVDPIDGTREFVQEIPEWSVSIALIEEHTAVAGGVLNPSTGEMFLGSMETGLEVESPSTLNRYKKDAQGSCLLVSRREYRERKWEVSAQTNLHIVPIGSIAYRMARVAAGCADATCTFEPRSEWDIAGGVALVHAAGGRVQAGDGSPIRFNKPVPLVNGVVALGGNCDSLVPTLSEIGMRS